jgi:hypothetical protein
VAAQDICFPALLSNMCCSIDIVPNQFLNEMQFSFFPLTLFYKAGWQIKGQSNAVKTP